MNRRPVQVARHSNVEKSEVTRSLRACGRSQAARSRHWKVALLCALALLLVGVPDASACAACFGASDSRLAEGMNAGIFALMGVIGGVLFAIAGFFFYLVRRAGTHPLPVPAEPFPSVATSKA